MTFSVLMSVYKNDNPEHFKLALESIYEKQTRKPDEIVLIFDGPVSDELSGVADDFVKGKEDIIKLVKLPENRGLAEALNAGYKYCTKDYICRMDSDDINFDTRFEKQAAFADAHKDIDVFGASILEFNQSIDEKNFTARVGLPTHEEIVKRAQKRNPMNHMTICMKRSALEKMGGYITLHYLEDYYLWLRMIVAGYKFANIEEPLTYARVGNGVVARRSSKKIMGGWKVIQKYMLDNNLIGKKRAMMNIFTMWVYIYSPAKLKTFVKKNIFRKKASNE